MADSKRHEEWMRAAWTVSWVRGALTGERLVPEDITPFRKRVKPKSPQHLAAENRQAWAALRAVYGIKR